MAIDKKIEYLISIGYPKEIIEFVKRAGVTKHLAWISQQLKYNKITLNETLFEKIKMANSHLNYIGKNIFNSLKECIDSAVIFETKNKEIQQRILHKFKNGFYIIDVKEDELKVEGTIMSNCVGSYHESVKSKETAILALKDKKGRTLVHFQILSNGMLSQHFEKANMKVRPEYLKYIIDFFKNNKKEGLHENNFGDFKIQWITRVHSDFNISVQCVIPKSISAKLVNGGIIKEIQDCIVLKNFEFYFFDKNIMHTFFNNACDRKASIANIDLIKESLMYYLDDIKTTIESINGYELFLSDNIKERIFGKKYIMKGFDYDFSEVVFSHMINVNNIHNLNVVAIENNRAQVGFNQRIGRIENGIEAPAREEPVPIQVEEVDRTQDGVKVSEPMNEEERAKYEAIELDMKFDD